MLNRSKRVSVSSVRMLADSRFAVNRLGAMAVTQQRVHPEVTEERHGHVQGDGQRCNEAEHGLPESGRRWNRRDNDDRYDRSSILSASYLQKTHIRIVR